MGVSCAIVSIWLQRAPQTSVASEKINGVGKEIAVERDRRRADHTRGRLFHFGVARGGVQRSRVSAGIDSVRGAGTVGVLSRAQRYRARPAGRQPDGSV